MIPALLTTMSRRPHASTNLRMAPSTAAGFVTSAAIQSVAPPIFFAAASAAAASRSSRATRAPSAASLAAMANRCPGRRR